MHKQHIGNLHKSTHLKLQNSCFFCLRTWYYVLLSGKNILFDTIGNNDKIKHFDNVQRS
jgi:hypothetical protein